MKDFWTNPETKGETFPMNPSASVSGIYWSPLTGNLHLIPRATFLSLTPGISTPSMFWHPKKPSPLSNTLFQLQVTFCSRLEVEIACEGFLNHQMLSLVLPNTSAAAAALLGALLMAIKCFQTPPNHQKEQ